MIFYWLHRLLAFLRWLVVMPAARDVARIDPNMRCPICGFDRGTLRCVQRSILENKAFVRAIVCEHTCGQCGARYFERPVVKVTAEMVYPAIPRNAIEEREDIHVITTNESVATRSVRTQ